jgi:hypothetical protein
MAKPIDLSTHRDSIGSELFDLGIRDAEMAGVVYKQEGRYYTSRDRIEANKEAFNQLIDKNGSGYLQAKLKDLTKKIVAGEDKVASISNPEERAKAEADLKALRNEKSNLMMHQEEVGKYTAKRKAEVSMDKEDPKVQAQIEKDKADARSADASAQKKIAEAATVEGTGGIDWKATNQKKTREASIGYMVQSGMIPEELVASAMGDMYMEGDKIDETRLYIVLRSEHPDLYGKMIKLQAYAKEEFVKSKGQIDEVEAVSLANDRIEEEYIESMARGAEAQSIQREVFGDAIGGVNSGMAVDRAYSGKPSPNVKAGSSAPQGELSGMDTPNSTFTVSKDAFVAMNPYEYQDAQGKKHMSKKKLKVTYYAPKGFTEQDAKDLADEVNKARKDGVSMNDIVMGLKDIGFVPEYER